MFLFAFSPAFGKPRLVMNHYIIDGIHIAATSFKVAMVVFQQFMSR